MMRYSIRITYVSWAAIDGGPDLHGTEEEMEAVAKRWRGELHPNQEVVYEVVPYVGIDPADRETIEGFLARETFAKSGRPR